MDIFIDNYNDWVNLAKSFVGDNYAHDIVQEAYIKIHDKKELNRSYIYLTIKHLSLDLLKSNNKVIKLSLEDYQDEESNIEKKQAYEELISKIEEEINTWRWYDAKLFNLYKDTSMSFRDLSLETGISLVSIFHTVKDCKQIIKNDFTEDYQDYKNQD